MTNEEAVRLKEIEDRQAKATKEPWFFSPSADPEQEFPSAYVEESDEPVKVLSDDSELGYEQIELNWDFVMNSRSDIPFLLKLIRSLAQEAPESVGGEDALRAFANDILKAWPEGDVDGGELQDAAFRHGLLRVKDPAPTTSCGEGCTCADYFDEDEWAAGVTCYERTELLQGDKP